MTSSTTTVRAWDLPVRVFHWLLVVAIATSYFSAEYAYMEVHKTSGIVILSLVLTRILWGVVGSTTARFSNFLSAPGAVVRYVRAFTEGRPEHPLGHSALGGWAVIVLLGACLTQATLGLFSNDDFFFDGPLVRYVSDDLSDALTGWHHRFFSVLVALIVIHVGANLVYLKKGQNLIRPMVTGKKRAEDVDASARTEAKTFRSPWLALVLWACVWAGLMAAFGEF